MCSEFAVFIGDLGPEVNDFMLYVRCHYDS